MKTEILNEGSRVAENVNGGNQVIDHMSQDFDNLDLNKQKLERTASDTEKKHNEEYTSQNFDNSNLGYQRLEKTPSQKEHNQGETSR